MPSRVTAIGLFVLACSVGTLAIEQPSGGNPEAAKLRNPVPATPESIAGGSTLYRRRCAACHGIDAKGGPPKEDFLKPASNLVDDKFDHGSSDGEIFFVIKNGVPPELVMDGWGERLSDTEIWNIVNYLRDTAKKSGGQTAKTAKDGIYKGEQAERGQAVYQEKCSACHGDDLSGGGFAPALAADAFSAAWTDKRLDTLFTAIKDTMPADRAGSLSPETSADLVAYILKFNGFPPGQEPLPKDSAALHQIVIAKP